MDRPLSPPTPYFFRGRKGIRNPRERHLHLHAFTILSVIFFFLALSVAMKADDAADIAAAAVLAFMGAGLLAISREEGGLIF